MELFIECPVKKNMKGNKKHSWEKAHWCQIQFSFFSWFTERWICAIIMFKQRKIFKLKSTGVLTTLVLMHSLC
jgi:hypothetical protein